MKSFFYVLLLIVGIVFLLYLNIHPKADTTDYCKIELRNHADKLHQEIDNAQSAFQSGDFDSGMYILENVPHMNSLLECDY